MERLTPINEIERIISDLCEQKNYWEMRYKLNGDEDSCKYIAINDAAIKALEEKLESYYEIKTIKCGYWSDYNAYCSECKKYSQSGIRTNYCPNCGAKMR